MPRDPTIAIRDCLTEIAILQGMAARLTAQAFRNDQIARRATAYAIQTISEAVRQIPDDWLADFPTEPWGQIIPTALNVDRHPEVAAEGGPRRMRPERLGRCPSRLASLAPQGDGNESATAAVGLGHECPTRLYMHGLAASIDPSA